MIEVGENVSKDTLVVYFQVRINKDAKIENRYYLFISSSMDLGCSGTEANYVKIMLDNGEVIKLDKDISKVKCGKHAESVYEYKGETARKLKYTNIKSIKLNQSKYYSDFNIWYPDFSIKMMKVLDGFSYKPK